MGTSGVFAVAGSKGGVGKTTTSINLCAVLAELGHDVVLVEMDLAMANVGDFLDIDVHLEGDDPTLHEVLGGTASVVDATYDTPCGFDVVPSGASLQGFVNANVDAVSGALATLRFAYDVVVLDTGAGVMPSTLVSLALADETILISSPRVASVRDTKKTRDITRQVGGNVAGVVFVKSGTGRSPGVDRIAEFLSVDLLGFVPKDDAVASAQDVGKPVVVTNPESDAATAYRALGDSIHERIAVLDSAQSTALSDDRSDGNETGFAFIEPGEPVDQDGAGGDVARDDVARDDDKELVGDDGEQVQETAGGTFEREPEDDVEREAGDGAEAGIEDEAEGRTETDNTDNVEETVEDGTEETPPTAVSCDVSGRAEGQNGETRESSAPTPTAAHERETERQAVARDRTGGVHNTGATGTEEEPVATGTRLPEPVSAGPTDVTEARGGDSGHAGAEGVEEKRRASTDTVPSVTKRLIDRAKDLVNRDDD